MRRLHRLYAWLFGYFWLPCPICGRMFGGHETGDMSLAYREDRTLVTRVCCKLHNTTPSPHRRRP